jgi:hypothetical protein
VPLLSLLCVGKCEFQASAILPFPDFPVCRVIKTTVHALIHEVEITREEAENTGLEYIGNVFISSFNAAGDSTGRVVLAPAVRVQSTLTIVLHGVDAVMNDAESSFFTDRVQAIVGDSLLEAENSALPLALDTAEILSQITSSGESSNSTTMTFGTGTVSDSNNTASSGNETLLLRRQKRALSDNGKYNQIRLVLTATCANAAICANESLRSTVDQASATYGDRLLVSLLMGNNANQLYYFDDITNVTTADDSVATNGPALASSGTEPAKPAVTPNAAAPRGKKKWMPRWFWILILICISFVGLALLYVCVRATIRAMNEDELRTSLEEQHAPTSDRRKSFSASNPPTLSQVKELEREQYPYHQEQAPQQPSQPLHNRLFSRNQQRDNAHNKKTVREMEDDAYDNRSYGNEEFSVGPGNFRHGQGDNDYDYDEEEEPYYEDDYDRHRRPRYSGR